MSGTQERRRERLRERKLVRKRFQSLMKKVPGLLSLDVSGALASLTKVAELKMLYNVQNGKNINEFRVLAVLGPKYGIELPSIREETRELLISVAERDKDQRLKEACEMYPIYYSDVTSVSRKPKNNQSKKSKSKPKLIDRSFANEFYETYEWRKLRYSVIKKHGKKCMACGRSDLPIHVDHIKPLRKNWHLRLEFSNLQILCEECNHGKGNWDETDWRPS